MVTESSFWQWIDLGTMAYRDALALQRRQVAARQSDAVPDTVFLVEHPPVFTLGKRGGLEHLRVSETALAGRGISVVPVERGGTITYHGPGQLVVYPIVHLSRRRLGVAVFVERLEEAMIRTSAVWGIHASRDPRNTGIWAGDRKLGSIGIAVRRGVSYHGLALNVAPDLTPFDWIDPCGLTGVRMTSLNAEGAKGATVAAAKSILLGHLADLFGVSVSPGTAPRTISPIQ